MERAIHLVAPRAGDPPGRGGRRSQRFVLQARVELVAPEAGSGQVLEASSTGMRVRLDRPLVRGDTHMAIIEALDGREYRELVRVVWVRRVAGGGCTAGLEYVAP